MANSGFFSSCKQLLRCHVFFVDNDLAAQYHNDIVTIPSLHPLNAVWQNGRCMVRLGETPPNPPVFQSMLVSWSSLSRGKEVAKDKAKGKAKDKKTSPSPAPSGLEPPIITTAQPSATGKRNSAWSGGQGVYILWHLSQVSSSFASSKSRRCRLNPAPTSFSRSPILVVINGPMVKTPPSSSPPMTPGGLPEAIRSDLAPPARLRSLEPSVTRPI